MLVFPQYQFHLDVTAVVSIKYTHFLYVTFTGYMVVLGEEEKTKKTTLNMIHNKPKS